MNSTFFCKTFFGLNHLRFVINEFAQLTRHFLRATFPVFKVIDEKAAFFNQEVFLL